MTFTCAETEARLVDVVDGRLDPPTELRVHAHLEACDACRQKAALWRALVPDMRALAPAPPADMAARRIEVEVMRRLRSSVPPRHVPAWRRWVLAGGGAALVAAAAIVAVWLRPSREADGGARYATVARVEGRVTGDGRPLAPPAALAPGARIDLAPGDEVELAMERGTTLRLRGPARLALGGTAANAELRLDQGVLAVAVSHRLAGESFVVSTRDARVEVRGTRFEVAADTGSRITVEEGQVAVRFADGREQFLGAGQSASSVPVEAPEGTTDSERIEQPAAEPVPAPDAQSCGQQLRTCQGTARGARDSMRAGDNVRALRLVAASARADGAGAPACGRALAGCEDELRYLHAEALRGAGRVDDAITAFRGLSRPGAPAAMRQNALYAAADLERRQGRAREASADYEGALAVAPAGALREEARIGAMESAEMSGQAARARAHAQRYLAEFPGGRAGATARRLADRAGPTTTTR